MGMMASSDSTTPFHFAWSPGRGDWPASLELVKPLHRLRDVGHYVGRHDVKAQLLRGLGASEAADVGGTAGGLEPPHALRRERRGHPGEDVAGPPYGHRRGVCDVEPDLLAVAHNVRRALQEDDHAMVSRRLLYERDPLIEGVGELQAEEPLELASVGRHDHLAALPF